MINDIEVFLKAGLSLEEIESLKQGIEDVENGNTISLEEVKIKARKKIFFESKVYA